MTASAPLSLGYKACSADDIRTEFGVCRGEKIRSCEDLVLGDTYIPKRAAVWIDVLGGTDAAQPFHIERAANLPVQTLYPLSSLIFMTTTGRRCDVIAAASQGKMYFVGHEELVTGMEYVLIDIRHLDAHSGPTVVPLPRRNRADLDSGRRQILGLIG